MTTRAIRSRLDKLEAELRVKIGREWSGIEDAISANFEDLSDQELETLIDAIERGDDLSFDRLDLARCDEIGDRITSLLQRGFIPPPEYADILTDWNNDN